MDFGDTPIYSHTALAYRPKLSHQPFRSFSGPSGPLYIEYAKYILLASGHSSSGRSDCDPTHPGQVRAPGIAAAVIREGEGMARRDSILCPMFEMKLMKQHSSV